MSCRGNSICVHVRVEVGTQNTVSYSRKNLYQMYKYSYTKCMGVEDCLICSVLHVYEGNLPSRNMSYKHLCYWRILGTEELPNPKFLLLCAWQANKTIDKLLGQGITTLFGKPADWEVGGLVSQRTVLPGLEFRLLLY